VPSREGGTTEAKIDNIGDRTFRISTFMAQCPSGLTNNQFLIVVHELKAAGRVIMMTHGRTSLSRSMAAKLASPTPMMRRCGSQSCRLDQDLSAPIGEPLVRVLSCLVFLPLPFRGGQDSQERQSPTPARPSDLRQEHQREPAQAAGP
jgi:hypothetical protein